MRNKICLILIDQKKEVWVGEKPFLLDSSRRQETTASGRGGMCSRVTGMSPHMGVRQETAGFARGAPFAKGIFGRIDERASVRYRGLQIIS